MQIVIGILIWLVGSVIGRVLVGAGLAIGFHVWVTDAVEGFLAQLVSEISGMGAMGQILLISGAGSALSIIGGALLARATIVAAGIWIGRRT